MSKPTNDSMIQILEEDAEQVDNGALDSTMKSSDIQREKQVHQVNSFRSLKTFECKQPLRPLTAYNIFFSYNVNVLLIIPNHRL